MPHNLLVNLSPVHPCHIRLRPTQQSVTQGAASSYTLVSSSYLFQQYVFTLLFVVPLVFGYMFHDSPSASCERARTNDPLHQPPDLLRFLSKGSSLDQVDVSEFVSSAFEVPRHFHI